MNSEKNKLIAKNTFLLYIRMLITMSVALYTSRIILNVLGIDDFGIYNVVGGMVGMFAFINSSMASATQRFLSFELGKKNYNQLSKIFSMSVNIHAIIALVIFFLSETVGLWFVNTQLFLPSERIVAANWVYQFSILTFLINIISVPYNAAIIAHEKMNVYALVGFVEVILKLLIVFMLLWFGYDKLILFAILTFIVSLIIRFIYGIYCKKKFPESKFYFFWDKKLFKTLINYTGWNLWGNVASVLSGQGINILINIFFGPAINAARGIAYQVQGAIGSFVQNFQIAINPQITKSFASEDFKYLHQLIFRGSKFSFFLLFVLSLPILLETNIILKLWLKIVPEYAVIFTQLVIINALIDTISGPLMTAAQASGKIKLYQSVVGGLLILLLPISYFFLKLDHPPQVTLYVSILISVIAFFARLKIISPLVDLSIVEYFKNVIGRIISVTAISIIFPVLIKSFLQPTLLRFLIIGFISSVSVLLSVYLIGLKREEQEFMKKKVLYSFNKIKKL